MRSVAPTRRLNRRSRDLLLAAALVFLLGAALAVAGIALHVLNLVVPSNRGYASYDLARKAMLFIGFGATFAAMLMAVRAAAWRTDNAGARKLTETLAEELDQSHVLIRNLSLRGVGAIDATLISRHGLLVLRVSRRKGIFLNDGERWLRRGRRGKWRAMRWNPSREVRGAAAGLKAYLAEYGLGHAPVYAAVVFVRDAPATTLHSRESAVPATHAKNLTRTLKDSYFAQARLSPQTVQELVNLLYQ